MNFLSEYTLEYAAFVVRLIAGILYLMQGYDKVFRIGLKETMHTAAEALRPSRLPSGMVRLMTAIISLTELTGGFMLVIGFAIVPSCYILLGCLVPVTLAMTMREPLWTAQTIWARLVLLLFLLLIPVTAHIISIDYLLNLYAK